MKKGFTLTELLVTIIIIAVLASVALPGFTKTAEKARANQAIAYLRVIRTAEKMYYSRTGKYWPNTDDPAAAGGSTTTANAAQIAARLGADIPTTDFSFSVVTDATAANFDATATRTGDATKTLTVNNTGGFTGSESYTCYVPAS